MSDGHARPGGERQGRPRGTLGQRVVGSSPTGPSTSLKGLRVLAKRMYPPFPMTPHEPVPTDDPGWASVHHEMLHPTGARHRGRLGTGREYVRKHRRLILPLLPLGQRPAAESTDAIYVRLRAGSDRDPHLWTYGPRSRTADPTVTPWRTTPTLRYKPALPLSIPMALMPATPLP